MNSYTHETKQWLDKRFTLYSDGVYIPNQPIYGFSKLKERLDEYARTMKILTVLDRLPFNNAIDVGCADGYFPHLIDQLFQVPVIGSELSVTALDRAAELFQIQGVVADAHDLPFASKSFELTLCSEMLEHVTDPSRVVAELVRMTRGFVVLTTPAAHTLVEQQLHFAALDKGEHHRHIHFFLANELKSLFPVRTEILTARSKLVSKFFDLVAADNENQPILRRDFYNFIVSNSKLSTASRASLYEALVKRYERPRWWDQFCDAGCISFFLRLDLFLSRLFPAQCLDFVIIADCRPDSIGEYWGRPKRGLNAILRHVLREQQAPYLRKKAQ